MAGWEASGWEIFVKLRSSQQRVESQEHLMAETLYMNISIEYSRKLRAAVVSILRML